MFAEVIVRIVRYGFLGVMMVLLRVGLIVIFAAIIVSVILVAVVMIGFIRIIVGGIMVGVHLSMVVRVIIVM